MDFSEFSGGGGIGGGVGVDRDRGRGRDPHLPTYTYTHNELSYFQLIFDCRCNNVAIINLFYYQDA